jgi:cation diffusion facilitator CzcD-associated flavoprotein CzcO
MTESLMSTDMTHVAIVGAGPYGLSIAAYFRRKGIPYRIFGRPMDSWVSHMPKGMMLKSDGFASNLYDPEAAFTLKRFCAERGIQYADTGVPVSLDTFCAYGLAFRDRMVPDLEDKQVVGIDHSGDGFILRLNDGELAKASRVVLAVGITHFENVPSNLASLPAQYFSHSARHREVEAFRGRSVVVIGAGASALDMAGLMHDAGTNVELVSRKPELNFHNAPSDKPRSWWQRLRHPSSGLGPGVRSRFFANSPWAFHYLPEHLRLEAVQRALGPSGGYFIKNKVVGKVPLHLGYSPESAEIRDGRVHLKLRSADGSEKEIVTDHIVAGTGYRVNLNRLLFLSEQIRSQVKQIDGSPVLSSSLESSVPGLYFAGIAAANSFGPVMRFAFGAKFAAERLTQALKRTAAGEAVAVSPARVAATAK